MNDRERAEGLAAAARVRRDELIDLASVVASRHRVQVLDGPAPGSVMIDLAGPVGSFCLGEAVVTAATAIVGGRAGWGWVLGFDDEAALAAALCDAAGGVQAERLAMEALALEQADRIRTRAAVSATRVGP